MPPPLSGTSLIRLVNIKKIQVLKLRAMLIYCICFIHSTTAKRERDSNREL